MISDLSVYKTNVSTYKHLQILPATALWRVASVTVDAIGVDLASRAAIDILKIATSQRYAKVTSHSGMVQIYS